MSDQNQSLEIKRGEIYYIDLPQIEGSIQYGRRPCLVYSNSQNNFYSSLLNVIPLTSKLRKVYPMHVLIGTECGLNAPSYALTEQLMPVMKTRVIHKIGQCDEFTMKRVEEGLKIQHGIKAIRNNNEFNEQRIISMVEDIMNLDKFIIKYKLYDNKEMIEDRESQIHCLESYCKKFNLNIEKYYVKNTNINYQGGIVYA